MLPQDKQQENQATGAWVISRVWSKTGVIIDVKASGPCTSAAIDDLYAGIAHGIEKFGWAVAAPEPPAAPAPAIDPAAKIALEAGNKDMARELQQQAAEVPPAPGGKQYQITAAAFVKILPQPDNKVTIEFYGNDKRTPHNDYPSVKVNKWDLNKAAGLMKHVTSADLSRPAEFMLNCHVYWTEGKEYTGPNGSGHYKDVHHVR